MYSRGMDTNILKYQAFVKSAETKSFTKAAESLHYTQGGVSRMIADLENEWQVSLFSRGKKGSRTHGRRETAIALCRRALRLV
jgi:DNA-binding transcriptional LysR family regulator